MDNLDHYQKKWNVSRETILLFQKYSEELIKWNKTYNLISQSDEQILWSRHFDDCLKLLPYIEKNKTILDMGSGAGFPGMVLSFIISNPITLIESREKKVVFLERIKNICKSRALIIQDRIENHKEKYNIITARALAPLNGLLKYSHNKLLPKGICLFLKGKNYKDEIDSALKNFKFKYNVFLINENSAILLIKNIYIIK